MHYRRLSLVSLLGLILAACAPSPATVPLPAPATPTETAAINLPTDEPVPQPTPSPAATPTSDERVLLISVDGLRPDAITPQSAPNMMALAGRGAFTWQAQTVNPPITLPSHTSMLTGLDIAQHGITWNNYRPNEGTVAVPTIFSIAHDNHLRTAMVYGKVKFLHLAAPNTLDEVIDGSGHTDLEVSASATEVVAAGFDVLFVHLPNVDLTGHTFGWMSERYLEAVAQADEAIGLLINALDDAGLAQSTVVIVTADHGGNGNGHSKDVAENRTIPWIIAGPGVRANHELATHIVTMDTAATILFALGLDVPDNWQGQPVSEAFLQDE